MNVSPDRRFDRRGPYVAPSSVLGRGTVGGALAALLVIAVGPWMAGCNSEGCCNSCTRNYRLDESSGLGGVELEGGTSGGECEIGDKPREYESGDRWVTGTIGERSTRSAGGETHYRYVLESVTLAEPESPPSGCDDIPTFDSPDELVSQPVDERTEVCVRGEVVSMTTCTQKGCPTI